LAETGLVIGLLEAARAEQKKKKKKKKKTLVLVVNWNTHRRSVVRKGGSGTGGREADKGKEDSLGWAGQRKSKIEKLGEGQGKRTMNNGGYAVRLSHGSLVKERAKGGIS